MKEFNFFVMGKGRFPFDMLRYDRCWPRSSHDVWKLDDPQDRTIYLTATTKPTPARWASFGWHMQEEK